MVRYGKPKSPMHGASQVSNPATLTQRPSVAAAQKHGHKYTNTMIRWDNDPTAVTDWHMVVGCTWDMRHVTWWAKTTYTRDWPVFKPSCHHTAHMWHGEPKPPMLRTSWFSNPAATTQLMCDMASQNHLCSGPASFQTQPHHTAPISGYSLEPCPALHSDLPWNLFTPSPLWPGLIHPTQPTLTWLILWMWLFSLTYTTVSFNLDCSTMTGLVLCAVLGYKWLKKKKSPEAWTPIHEHDD